MGDISRKEAAFMKDWVQKARDDGYSDSEIDAALANSNKTYTIEDINNKLNPNLSTAGKIGDAAASAGIGVVKGTASLGGMFRDIPEMGRNALFYGLQRALGNSPEEASAKLKEIKKKEEEFYKNYAIVPRPPGYNDIMNGIESIFGPTYEPKTKVGDYAQSIGEMVPAVAGGPANIGKKAALAVLGGAVSQFAGDATEGTALEPWARAIGAGAGLSIPSLGAFLRDNVAPRALISSETAAARELRGLDISPADIQNQASAALASGKPLLPADITERASKSVEKAIASSKSPELARRKFSNRNVPGYASDDIAKAISTEGANTALNSREIADSLFNKFRQGPEIQSNSNLSALLNTDAAKKAASEMASTIPGAKPKDILTQKSWAPDDLERFRNYLTGRAAAAANPAYAKELRNLANNIVEASGNDNWKKAINASSENLRIEQASKNIKPLLDPKLSDEELITRLSNTTQETDLSKISSLIDDMRLNQNMQRTNEAAGVATPKDQLEPVIAGAAAAMASGMPRKSVFEMIITSIEGTEKHRQETAAAILDALSDPNSPAWGRVYKMNNDRMGLLPKLLGSEIQYQEGKH